MARKREFDQKTRELLRLMHTHRLTTRAVAALIGRSRQCVKRWTSEQTVIGQQSLDLLKYKIRDSL